MASLQAHLAVCMIKWRVKRRLKNCRDYRLARQILRPPPCKTPASVRITNAKVNGIPGEWLESPNSAQSVLLYLHGGGYFGCSAETHRPITAWFAMHGFRIFAPNYRLAPENPCGGRDRELENLAGRSTRLATRAALDSRSSPIATRSSRFPSQACCRRDLAWCTMDARCLSPPATATTSPVFLRAWMPLQVRCSNCPRSIRKSMRSLPAPRRWMRAAIRSPEPRGRTRKARRRPIARTSPAPRPHHPGWRPAGERTAPRPRHRTGDGRRRGVGGRGGQRPRR